jgi:isopenicillin N synthase-like dioxygenase
MIEPYRTAEEFPIVDFSKFQTNAIEVSNELFQAACKWGFLVLTGHGIQQKDIDEMFAMVSSCGMAYYTGALLTSE